MNNIIPVKVARAEMITPLVRHFTLRAVDGLPLPVFAGGSHVIVSMYADERVIKNPYSLLSDPADTGSYGIAVRLQEASRGGSRYMHEAVRVGDMLEISRPVNLFPLDTLARKHLLIAGGIGITPFMSQIHDLKRRSAAFELHYAVRSLANAPFAQHLLNENPGRVHLYADDQGERLDLDALLGDQPLGTHVYVCGPQGLMNGVRAAAQRSGWEAVSIHSEAFTAPIAGAPYTAVLARTGQEIEIGPEQTLLEAAEAAGIYPNYMCRGGVCGVCETRVLDGQVKHLDHYLSAEDQATHQKMMICVSRAACERIVIDL